MRLSGNSDALLSGLGRYGAILIGCFPERSRNLLLARYHLTIYSALAQASRKKWSVSGFRPGGFLQKSTR